MSLALLRTTLNRLTAQTYSSQSRGRLLRDVFSLINDLSNPKNVEVLLRAFLISPFWANGEAVDAAYSVTDAARYLSPARATAQASICKNVINSSSANSWRKAILLAALIAAEGRDLDSPPSFLSSSGSLGSTFVRTLNTAAVAATEDANAKAGLLIATSWVLFSLTPYQRSRITSQTNLALFHGLYSSQLAFTEKVKADPQPRGLRELGLMTRVLVELLSTETETSVLLSATDLLLSMNEQLADDLNHTDRFAKSVFLSSIALLQAIVTAAMRNEISQEHRTVLAVSTLNILKRLQNANPDNSVFETWRFVFNASLDMLDSTDAGLSTYLDSALKFSPFSTNPLSSSVNKEIFSKRKDDDQVKWLLTVIEASASTIKNPKTLQRIFSFCFSKLNNSENLTKEEAELLHSVTISLITAYDEEFRPFIRPYAQNILQTMDSITDRQFAILYKALYRASLTTKSATGSADPTGVLFMLKNKSSTTDDLRVKKLCGTTMIELLPIVPSHHLKANLIWVDENIACTDGLCELEPRFIEVCQTEMDSARALVCVKFLLERSQRGNATAIRANL